MAAKKPSTSFQGLLASIGNGGPDKIVEYGGARIKVRNVSIGESRRIEAMRRKSEAANKAGEDDPSFTEELLSVFIRCALDAETGDPLATEADRDLIRERIPSELVFRVFQAAAVPDIGQAAKN